MHLEFELVRQTPLGLPTAVGTEWKDQYSVHTYDSSDSNLLVFNHFLVTLYAVGYLAALFALCKQKNKDQLNWIDSSSLSKEHWLL